MSKPQYPEADPNEPAWFRPRPDYARSSADFLSWSDFENVLRMDEWDTPGTQFYSISPFAYGNRYLAFVDLYDTEVEKIWVTLASSPDGARWLRPRREAFLDLGPDGQWDDTWINVTNNPPIRQGRHLRFWYIGNRLTAGFTGSWRSGRSCLAPRASDARWTTGETGRRMRLFARNARAENRPARFDGACAERGGQTRRGATLDRWRTAIQFGATRSIIR